MFIGQLSARRADLAAAKKIGLLIKPINAPRPAEFFNRVEHAADIVAKVGKPKHPRAIRFL